VLGTTGLHLLALCRWSRCKCETKPGSPVHAVVMPPPGLWL
jgi:hypothetical protein